MERPEGLDKKEENPEIRRKAVEGNGRNPAVALAAEGEVSLAENAAAARNAWGELAKVIEPSTDGEFYNGFPIITFFDPSRGFQPVRLGQHYLKRILYF